MSRFMAADPSSGPRFFLDEEKNDSFLQNLQDRKSHVPSDVERQSAAAIRAVIDDDDDELELVNPLESRQDVGSSFEEPKSSFVVDLGSDSAPEPGTKPLQTIWSKIQAGWVDVEDRLVEWFGLDQSKYQWALDEFMDRQLAGDNPQPGADGKGLQLQEIVEQKMKLSYGDNCTPGGCIGLGLSWFDT